MKKGFTCLLGLLSAVHWFSSPAWAQVTKLKAAYSAESSWSLATWVANDAGLYKKYGLDVDLVLIRSAATITAALIAGETPMIQLGGNGTIQAALQGADTVNVQTLVPIIPQSLVVTPDIKSPEDLKGKRVGVSRFGALSDLVIRRYLRKIRSRSGERCDDRAGRGDSRTARRNEGGCDFRRFAVSTSANGGQKGRFQRAR